MILSFIEAYILNVITALNATAPANPDLTRIATDMVIDDASAAQCNFGYQIVIIDTNPMGQGNKIYELRCRINLVFSLNNNQPEYYKNAIEDYVYPLNKLFLARANSYYKNASYANFHVNNVTSARIVNGDSLDKNYVRPGIELTLTVSDDNI